MSSSPTTWFLRVVLAAGLTACEPTVRHQEVTPLDSDGAPQTDPSGAADPAEPGDPATPQANGAPCTAGPQCQSSICIDQVCCAEACDAVCEVCDATGTCVATTDDDVCGPIDCDGLDSICRDYDDPAARCASRGVCKTANSPDCTVYLDAGTQTSCTDNDPGTGPDHCDGAGHCVGEALVLAKVGAFRITTDPVGSVVPVAGVGFTPKVLFLWWSGRTTDPATVTTVNGRQHYRRGFAFTTGPGQCRMVTNQAEDATSPADADRMYRTDACVSSLTRSGAIDGVADLATFDADGFSLQIVFDPFEENLAVTYLALGGTAITHAAVGTFASMTGATSGTQEITDVGFEPELVFFLSGYGVDAPPYWSSSASMSLGAATGPAVEQNAISVVAVPNGASPPASKGYGVMGEALATGNSWLTMYERGRLAAFLPQGFQIDWLEADSDDAWVYFYLAVRGGNPKLGSLLTLFNTTADVVAPVGYKPAGALLVSRGEDEDPPDSSNNRDAWSVGAFASPPTEQWVQGASHAALSASDPMPNSRASTVLSAENVYFRLADSGGVEASMALVSVETDGFACRMTDSDSGRQRLIWFLTFGPGVP